MDLLRIAGTVTAAPSTGSQSGHAALSAPIDEQFPVDHSRANLRYTLASDSPQAVALDGLSASFVLVKTNTKIRVRLTSTDGSQQSIPCTFLLLRSEDVPFTAIDLTRQTGVETLVDLTVGIVPA